MSASRTSATMLPGCSKPLMSSEVIPWATRSNVTAVHRADDNVIPYWVTIQ